MVRYELCSDANDYFASCGRDIVWDIELQENQELLTCEPCRLSQISRDKPQSKDERLQILVARSLGEPESASTVTTTTTGSCQAPANKTQDPKSLGTSVGHLVNPILRLSLEATGDKRKHATEVVEVQPAKKRRHSPTQSVTGDASPTSKITLVDPEDLEERERLKIETNEIPDRVTAWRQAMTESLLTAPVLATPPPSPMSVPARYSRGTPKVQEEKTPTAVPGLHGGPKLPPAGAAEQNPQGPHQAVVQNTAPPRPQFVPVAQGKEISRDGRLNETLGLGSEARQPPSPRGNNYDGEAIPDERVGLGSATAAPQPAADCSRVCTRCNGSGNEPWQLTC